METVHTHHVATAYDAIASTYDEMLVGDAWMRERLWGCYARLFRPGDRVLDVGCGTGADVLFLARQGVRVVGIDISQGMVARLREKVAAEHLDGLVEARVMDLNEIAGLDASSFDGIISAFAGLSSTPDLTPFASEAARLLRPKGRMIVHMLNRTSLWETLGSLKRGQLPTAQKAEKGGVRGFTIGGTAVRHYLCRPDEAYRRFFQPHFLLANAFSLGCLRPPHTVRRIPVPVSEALGGLERVVGRIRPFLDWGRFFVLEMVKR